ncbi:MAG: hypothetical protein BWX70_02690 [Verrucomicrobia bacterium ADurb.Bin070]|nr:MAG: hypothetical protein BWX70_02690 [Verrucomicrobia bacterium ADurb.Bin070]
MLDVAFDEERDRVVIKRAGGQEPMVHLRPHGSGADAGLNCAPARKGSVVRLLDRHGTRPHPAFQLRDKLGRILLVANGVKGAAEIQPHGMPTELPRPLVVARPLGAGLRRGIERPVDGLAKCPLDADAGQPVLQRRLGPGTDARLLVGSRATRVKSPGRRCPRAQMLRERAFRSRPVGTCRSRLHVREPGPLRVDPRKKLRIRQARPGLGFCGRHAKHDPTRRRDPAQPPCPSFHPPRFHRVSLLSAAPRHALTHRRAHQADPRIRRPAAQKPRADPHAPSARHRQSA